MTKLYNTSKTDGFALITVLGVVMLASLVLAGILYQLRIEAKQAAFYKNKIIANIAIENTIEILKSEIASKHITSQQQLKEFQVKNQGYEISIISLEEESLKYDINTFTRDSLYQVFLSLKFTEKESHIFADRIIDWRDIDTKPSEFGAESLEYIKADMTPPLNRPFYSTHELDLVLGLQGRLTDEQKSLFTVVGRKTNFVAALGDVNQNKNLIGRVLKITFNATHAPYDFFNSYNILVSGDKRNPVIILSFAGSF